jgi:hypothetical protein
MEFILTGKEYYEKINQLKLIKQLNWENYYLEENTGKKWIEEYPKSEMHGGGPPQLRLLQKFPWEKND